MIFFGPVRGPDFGPDITWSGPGPDFGSGYLVGPVRVRIFGPDNPDRSGLSVPVRNLVRIFQ